MAVRIQIRRDSSSNWIAANPVLALGEPGYDTTNEKLKIGDGVTAWNSLPYAASTDWDDLVNTPTTLSGYGITDAATSAQGALADSAIQPDDSPQLTNLTLTGYLAGPSTFIIDPAILGNDTGTLRVRGSLQVDGNTVDITALGITLANGAANPAAADGAGITVEGASATIVYDYAEDAWVVNKKFIGDNFDIGNININDNTINSTDTNGDITLNPNGTGVVNVSSSRITSLATPTDSNDATTKSYVDGLAQGLRALPSSVALSDSNLDAAYDNGTNGVGATLTANSNGAFPTIDDVSLSLNDSIIINGQTNAAHNGSYRLTTVGNGSTPWVLTRCTFCDEADEQAGSFEFVTGGTTYGNTGWLLTVGSTPVVMGTTELTWVQFSGAGSFTGGDGLDLTGTTFSVNVDDSTIEIFSDTLRVKDSGITNAKIANSTITVASDSGSNAIDLGDTLTVSGSDPVDTAVSGDTLTISVNDATTTTKGIASFATANFTVSSGAVSAKNITLGSSTLTLGSTTTAIAGLTQLTIDNIDINGNSITSTDTNGNINLTPDGSGEVIASTLSVSDLTDNRVVISGSSGALEDSANLTYDGTDLSTNSLIVTDLTDNRVVLAGSGGAIEDSANLTYDGSLFTVGGDILPAATDTYDLGSSSVRWQDLHLNGTLTGPATFVIDPAAIGDNTGTVVIAGNLQVDGTTTTINSTTLTVDDLNIVLASGAASAAAANGAGITIDGANATLTYDSGDDEFDFNKGITAPGATISGTATVNGIVFGASGINSDDSSAINFLTGVNFSSDISVGGNITPTSQNIDIGSSSARWQELYLTPLGVDINGARVTEIGGVINIPALSTIGGAIISSVDEAVAFAVALG